MRGVRPAVLLLLLLPLLTFGVACSFVTWLAVGSPGSSDTVLWGYGLTIAGLTGLHLWMEHRDRARR